LQLFRKASITILLAAMPVPGASFAQTAEPVGEDAAAGREIAAMCEDCHGLDGIKKQPDMPNIAGSDASYIARQLRAYQSGERKHEAMNAISESLDDEMIANLAAWYSAIEVQAKLPQ